MSMQVGKRARLVVRLANPVQFFDKQINEIALKEPGGGLYGRLGEPRLMVFSATGSGYYIEKDQTIRAYLDELIDHEQGDVLFDMLSLEDAKALREGLFGFFTAAEARLAARNAISSSSASVV